MDEATARRGLSSDMNSKGETGLTAIGALLIRNQFEPQPEDGTVSTKVLNDADVLCSGDIDIREWAEGRTLSEVRATINGLMQAQNEHRRRAEQGLRVERMLRELTQNISNEGMSKDAEVAREIGRNIGRGVAQGG